MAPQVKDPKYLEKLARTNFYGENGRFSLDNARAIYKWYLRNGLITGNLRKKTYDEFLAHVRSKMRLVEGKSARVSLTQILDKEAGGKYKGFKLEVNEDDIQNIRPDKRAFNTQVLNPIEAEYLTQKFGKERVKQYMDAVRRDKKAMTALNQFLYEKYGIKFDMGHFQPSASKKGGVYGERGTSPEPSSFNRLQGAQARANQEALGETGRSFSKIEDFFNWDQETQGQGPLGAKGLTPADFLAIERGADPNQILLARQQAIDIGEDIGAGVNYTEGMLRSYFGDTDFDDAMTHARESISRQAMQTGINPATNVPLTGQEKVDISLMERPSARARRSSLLTKMGGIHFNLDRAQTAEYLFTQGQPGSDLSQLTQQASESGMFEATIGGTAIGRTDPKTDVGKRTLEIMSDPETGRRLDEQRFVRGSERY